MAFQKPENWQQLLDAVKTENEYELILQSMQNGGKLTDAHLYVLEVYTADLCQQLSSNVVKKITTKHSKFKRKQNHSWWRLVFHQSVFLLIYESIKA